MNFFNEHTNWNPTGHFHSSIHRQGVENLHSTRFKEKKHKLVFRCNPLNSKIFGRGKRHAEVTFEQVDSKLLVNDSPPPGQLSLKSAELQCGRARVQFQTRPILKILK